MKLKLKHRGKEHNFEIQEMSALDYYNVFTKFRFGQLDFKTYADEILKECVVSPVEARKVEYFEKMPKVLDMLCGQIAKICDEGLEENVEIEIIEE